MTQRPKLIVFIAACSFWAPSCSCSGGSKSDVDTGADSDPGGNGDPGPGGDNDVVLDQSGAFEIGDPELTDIYLSPTGDDGASGNSAESALETLDEAFSRMSDSSATGYRFLLLPGQYPCACDHDARFSSDDYPELQATYERPVILQAANGPGTATIIGGLQLHAVSYVYLIDLDLTATHASHWGNNVLHVELGDHVLVRGCTVAGPDIEEFPDDIEETVKANQSQYIYIEDTDISGSYQVALDFVSVQYGHVLNSQFHRTNQWCGYVKGGSAYLTLSGNEMYDCVLGFQVGEGSNLEIMESPWLHYEAYDIRLINNVIHDIDGVPLSVAGGYNVLIAYNTVYRAADNDTGYSLFQLVRGNRVCADFSENGEGNAEEICQAYLDDGGWGTAVVTDMMAEQQWIPNRNVFVYNNVFYNPDGVESVNGHFNVFGPAELPAEAENITSPARTDVNAQIRGNVIWNGTAEHALGLDESTGCTNENPTCNEAQLLADNAINTIEPDLIDPDDGDFRPVAEGALEDILSLAIPDFSWADAPASPAVPQGVLSNFVPAARDGRERANPDHPGAY